MKARGQILVQENLQMTPYLQAEELMLLNGMNRSTRLQVFTSGFFGVCYNAEVKLSPRVISASFLPTTELSQLKPEIIPYLFPSRYCQSDRLRQMAIELFGHLSNPFDIASAVTNWIHNNILYVVGSTGENHSALDVLDIGRGVCRDFAHLGITFCRALNVPARYTSCYAHQLFPADFHACFEVFIGNTWYLFDATHLAPMNGIVRIASGRDAADVAVCTIFGNPECTRTFVSCECYDPEFQPIYQADLHAQGAAICRFSEVKSSRRNG